MIRSHRTTRPGRRGVTLLEVLVAIFIAGVGLLALLTLFPIGMTNMARAVNDDRSGHLKPLAAEILKVRDEVVASSQVALADLLQRDTSRAAAHCQQFAIHDGQLTALIQTVDKIRPNLPDQKDRQLAERVSRELTKWRETVRDVKESFRVLAEWEQQKSNPPPNVD